LGIDIAGVLEAAALLPVKATFPVALLFAQPKR
jgi:hypothetical protein